MHQLSNSEHIVCLALPAWEADYLRSTVELMKCLAKNNRVLYVDYAYTLPDFLKAMRSNTKIEWKRMLGIQKRLRKISGEGNNGLYLLSLPPVFPAFVFSSFRWFTKTSKINASLTAYYINEAIMKLSMHDVVSFNSFQPFLGRWWKLKNQTFSVYYCYDDFVNVPYFKGFAAETERIFISSTDLLIVTSDELKNRKRQEGIPTEVVYNGVHFDSFNRHAKPINKTGNKQSVVGYTGSIDDRIDIDLLEPVVKSLPQVCFQFIGKVSDKEIYNRLSRYANTSFLPPVASDQIPQLMCEMHAGIIPYKRNALTSAIYPLKANEYLAAGLPVVMTPFASIGEADNVVYRACTYEEFTKSICQALEENDPALQQKRINIARKADWATRAQQLIAIIKAYKAKKTALAA